MSLINPNPLWLEIPPISSPSLTTYSTAGARQRAQINEQCLIAFSDWLQTEFHGNAQVFPSQSALPSIWEVVTGTALIVDQIRLVLLPTEAIAVDELQVPQEWVDIPDWVADYYLAMQVDPEENGIQIVGYTSHQHLKTNGVYDADDRSYLLDADDLLRDIDSLWIAQEFHCLTTNRAAIAPLPTLPLAQATNLLERLGNPTVIFPRLAIPFPQWGALLAHGGWRQQLYERRQGRTMADTVPQWLQRGLSRFAHNAGWQRQNFVPVRAGVRSLNSGIVRPLAIAGQPYELRVFPINGLTSQTWRFELQGAIPDQLIPVGFTLRLLTEDLQAMAHNEDVALAPVESLHVDVMLEPGEGIVWETDPQPEECDREILRF